MPDQLRQHTRTHTHTTPYSTILKVGMVSFLSKLRIKHQCLIQITRPIATTRTSTYTKIYVYIHVNLIYYFLVKPQEENGNEDFSLNLNFLLKNIY